MTPSFEKGACLVVRFGCKALMLWAAVPEREKKNKKEIVSNFFMSCEYMDALSSSI